MRHAVVALLLVAGTPLACMAAPAGTVDAIAEISYAAGPKFKVGDWIRYRITGTGEQGSKVDYTVTIMVAGEELWWGERCFWIETQTSSFNEEPQVAASLLSYSIFEDSLPQRHFQSYVRKQVEGVDDHGNPIQKPSLRPATDLKKRGFDYPEPQHTLDTLGREHIETPKGTFDALKEMEKAHRSTASQEGDSTLYKDQVTEITRWWSDLIPLTRLAKMYQDQTQRRRAWMIGESEQAPLLITYHGTAATELVDYGTGMKARMVPEAFQRPLAEQQKPPSKTPAKGTKKKSTRS